MGGKGKIMKKQKSKVAQRTQFSKVDIIDYEHEDIDKLDQALLISIKENNCTISILLIEMTRWKPLD